MAKHFYRNILRGKHEGNQVLNILWYRDDGSTPFSGQPYFGAEDSAFQVYQEVWNLWKDCVPTAYTLESIESQAFNQDFQPFIPTPYEYFVQETGTVGGSQNGSAPTAILSAKLGQGEEYNGGPQPKRGYWAVGPMVDGWIEDSGVLLASVVAPGGALADLALKLKDTLTNAAPPGQFFPVKMSVKKPLLGGYTFAGYRDIINVLPRNNASFRRSRVNRAYGS